jgi:hypothetical protein
MLWPVVGVALFVDALRLRKTLGAPTKGHPKRKAPRLLTTAAHGMRSIPESFFGSFCSQKEQYPPVAKEFG